MVNIMVNMWSTSRLHAHTLQHTVPHIHPPHTHASPAHPLSPHPPTHLHTHTQLPASFFAYRKQQHRWTCGPVQLWKRTAGDVLASKLPLVRKLELLVCYFGLRKFATHWVCVFCVFCVCVLGGCFGCFGCFRTFCVCGWVCWGWLGLLQVWLLRVTCGWKATSATLL